MLRGREHRRECEESFLQIELLQNQSQWLGDAICDWVGPGFLESVVMKEGCNEMPCVDLDKLGSP